MGRASSLLVLALGALAGACGVEQQTTVPAPAGAPKADVPAAYRRWAESRAAETEAALSAERRETLDGLEAARASDPAVAAAGLDPRAVQADRARQADRFQAFVDAWLDAGLTGTEAAGVRVADELRDSEVPRTARARLVRRLSHGGATGAGATRLEDEVRMEASLTDWFESGYEQVEGRFRWTPETEWVLTGLEVTPVEPPPGATPPDRSEAVPAGSSPAGLQHQTCEQCRAVRYGRPGEPWHEVEARAGCRHEWRKGASSGLRASSRDGSVFLVRRGKERGAFRLERQTETPERVAYSWIVRDDGGSLLDPADPAVRHGREDDAREIRVGTMRIQWSVAQDGSGWIYHSRVPGTEPRHDDVLLCETALSDWKGADAEDPVWEYRAARGDEPTRGR